MRGKKDRSEPSTPQKTKASIDEALLKRLRYLKSRGPIAYVEYDDRIRYLVQRNGNVFGRAGRIVLDEVERNTVILACFPHFIVDER